ncbi:sensor histidine kinase [Paenibacillus rhizoplanae]
MANVHQRLQLHYGPAYGIEVFSKPGEGTDVILSLPLPGVTPVIEGETP